MNTMTKTAQRKLGRSNLPVSPMGLGCWAIGGQWKWLDGEGGWGDIDDDELVRAIHTAIDLGINFFDTAANYGAGHSERMLARALKGKRHQVVIATKFGFNVDEAEKHVTLRTDDHLKYVRQECEDSLRRLNTDVIDLYQLHVWDYPIEKVPAMVDLLELLVMDGKIRYYGWSTDSVEGARLFAQGEHCVAIQHDLNVILDTPEMLALCEELNLASVNRSPLARGALSGKYSKDATFPRMMCATTIGQRNISLHPRSINWKRFVRSSPAMVAPWCKARWPGSGREVKKRFPSPVSRLWLRSRKMPGLWNLAR